MLWKRSTGDSQEIMGAQERSRAHSDLEGRNDTRDIDPRPENRGKAWESMPQFARKEMNL